MSIGGGRHFTLHDTYFKTHQKLANLSRWQLKKLWKLSQFNEQYIKLSIIFLNENITFIDTPLTVEGQMTICRWVFLVPFYFQKIMHSFYETICTCLLFFFVYSLYFKSLILQNTKIWNISEKSKSLIRIKLVIFLTNILKKLK